MTKVKVRKAEVVAREMLTVRDELTPLENAYKELSAELLAAMKAERKTDEGLFHKRIRQTLVVSNKTKAAEFAKQYNCLKIDTSKALTMIDRLGINFTDGIGFDLKNTEYIAYGAEKKLKEDLGVVVT